MILPSLIFLIATALFDCVIAGSNVLQYRDRYLTAMNVGMRCHPGFVKTAPSIRFAAERCGKRPEIASYICYITCVYREFGYILPNDELDYALVNILTRECFDMESSGGQISYNKILVTRYECGQDFHQMEFAKTYNNATACDVAKTFLQCSFNSLMCSHKDHANINN